HMHLTSATSVLLLGAVALGIINYVRFRREFLAVLRAIGRGLRVVFLDLPSRLIQHPLVRKLLASKPALHAWRFVLKPGLLAALPTALAWSVGLSTRVGAALGLAAFVAASFLFNTRGGQVLEEVVVEQISHNFHILTFAVIPGLFRIIMSVFDCALEWVEKLIYAGDEWLRFREGQSRGLLAVKTVLGLVWGVVTYVVRIYLNLLVEPQLNPIKHFPVVTVAAKIMLPFALTLTRLFALVLTPLWGSFLGHVLAGLTVFFLPGVFGFLVWELKSNWRLYEANRPEALGPVAVGSHGETVVRLLRPGFHSGTLPKLFGRLRRARARGQEGKAARNREALHHVDEAVHRLVDRDLAALLRESRSLGDLAIKAGAVHLATNRIRIELRSKFLKSAGLRIDLEEQDGTLAAEVTQPGWLDSLNADQQSTLGIALAGFFRICGAEKVTASLERFDLSGAWSRAATATQVDPEPCAGAYATITWRHWIDAWASEAVGEDQREGPAWRTRFLPDKERIDSAPPREQGFR
ncbi:MAG: hypothetical protein ACP5XB_08070, partial [Isosphaeraceae bacterium]